MGELPVTLLIFGPAVLGLVVLVVGIVMLQRPKDASVNTTARVVIGTICLLAALGIGACYGLLFLGR
jgi:hypothetical protein